MKKYQELIAQCRDVVIVIFGLTYVVGTLLFGTYYSRYNVGAITAPSITYFVFGSGFTLLAVLMFILFDRAVSVWKQERAATRFSVAATWFSWIIVGTSLWVLVDHGFLEISKIFSSLRNLVSLCFFLPAAVTLVNLYSERHVSKWKRRWHLLYDTFVYFV